MTSVKAPRSLRSNVIVVGAGERLDVGAAGKLSAVAGLIAVASIGTAEAQQGPLPPVTIDAGLTLGVHSRIDETVARVVERLAVGNIYVNRNMIGAVVGVQPFGGHGLSGTGPKAGGPHYLPRFATEQTVTINTAAAGGNAALMAEGDGQDRA